MNKLTIILMTACLVFMSIHTQAQDTIRLTWQGSTTAKSVYLYATTGTDNINVDWGDGTTTPYSGNGDNMVILSHTYSDTNNYNVTITTLNNTNITKLSFRSVQLLSLDVSQCQALTHLESYGHLLASIDVSQNRALTDLDLTQNALTSLDISNNTALLHLACAINQLTALDISNNPSLLSVICGNNQLPLSQLYPIWTKTSISNYKFLSPQDIYDTLSMYTAMDLSSELSFGNPAAQTQFDITMEDSTSAAGKYTLTNGQLTFTALGDYRIVATNGNVLSGNQAYTEEVEVTYHIKVTNIAEQADIIRLTCQGSTTEKTMRIRATTGTNNIIVDWGDGTVTPHSGQGASTNVTLSHTYGDTNNYNVVIAALNSITKITYFSCPNNQISDLDVSQSTALTELHCYENQLTSLDVSNNPALIKLDCEHNQLSGLDASNNTALTVLYCFHNQLTSLNVSNNPALIKLDCDENQLSALDVSNNTALTELSCYNNQLSTLDVSQNPALLELYCYSNQLTSLDVSNNTALTELYCHDNQLIDLDISNNPALAYFSCFENQLPLSQLYPIWMNKNLLSMLSPQDIYKTVAVNKAIDLSGEMSFGSPALETQFAILMEDHNSAEGKYTFENGQLTFTELGDYKVVATNDSVREFDFLGGGGDTSVTVIYHIKVTQDGTGIDEWTVDNGQLTVYPNPTTGQLTIDSPSLRGGTTKQSSEIIEKVEIYALSGKIVETWHAASLQTIDISHLANGIYLIKVKTTEGEAVRKIVKQ